MKRLLRIALIVLGVLVVIALVVPMLVDVNSFRPRLESELTAALGREVKVGNLSLSVFSGSVTADDISIADDPAFGKSPFITAKRFKVGVHLLPLIFSKTLHVTGVTLDEPQITLLRGANRAWNFSSLGKGGPQSATKEQTSTALAVDRLNVHGGRLLVGEAHSAHTPRVYDKVNIEVKEFSPTTAFPFTLTAALPGGGDLRLQGNCGPIPQEGGAGTPLEATLKIRRLELATTGFAEASGIQGLADFDGTVRSDGQTARTDGTLKVEKLRVAANGSPSKSPVSVKYAVEMNLKTGAGSLSQGEIAIGKAVARLGGTFHPQEQATILNMKLTAPEMPVDDLAAALPAVGVTMPSGAQLQGGTLSIELAIAGPSSGPVVSGPIRLSNTKLAGFDLGSKLSAIPGLAGKQGGGKDTVIQNFSTTVHMAPDGTQANDINLTIPTLGVVTGAGTVSPSGALNFKMHADLSAAPGGSLIKSTGVGGSSGVPFSIEGTTADPKFVPDVKGMAGSAVQQVLGGSKAGSPLNAITGAFGKKKTK